MVNDAKKTKDCIIALTMVDLLHSDDIELFIDRVLMKNNEIKSLNIKKVIGVISHKNKDINENIWFENNILKEITDISLKEEISKNITLENLLISVDEIFNDFINTNWKNDAINKTNQQILKLENELNDLGKDITLSELLDFIKTNSNFNRLFEPRLAFIGDERSGDINPNDKYEYNYHNHLKELSKAAIKNQEILNENKYEIEDIKPQIKDDEATSEKSSKSQTIQQLKEQCKSLGIKGYSNKKKNELIELIKNHK